METRGRRVFHQEVRGDEPELASYLRIEERGGRAELTHR
jgi:hypothetical protein